ncbi:Inosose isomerase [compost metagenome]
MNNIEIFALRPGVSADDYLRSLERGARLGAAQATVHLHDLQGSQAVDLFAEFCQQVSEFGMNAALECTSFSSLRTFEQAAQIVTSVGMDNACMAVDALHFFRNGGQVDDISRWSTVPIGYVQLCDAPLEAPDDLYAEAVSDRMPPGEGEFPLSSLLASLPRDVMLDVEVPQHVLRDQGVSAFSRAAAVVGATRDLLEKSGL